MFVTCTTPTVVGGVRRQLSDANPSEEWAGNIGKIGVRLEPYGPRIMKELGEEDRKKWTSSDGLALNINLPSPSLEYKATCYLYAPDNTELARIEFPGIVPENGEVIVEDNSSPSGATQLSCDYNGQFLTSATIIRQAAQDIANLNNVTAAGFSPRLVQARVPKSFETVAGGVNLKMWVLPGEGPGVLAVARSVRNLLSFYHNIPSLSLTLPFFYGVSQSISQSCNISFVCDTSESPAIVVSDPSQCPPVSPSLLTLVGIGVSGFLVLVALVFVVVEARLRRSNASKIMIYDFYETASGREKEQLPPGVSFTPGMDAPKEERIQGPQGCWNITMDWFDLLLRASSIPLTFFSYWALTVHFYVMYYLDESTLFLIVLGATVLHLIINTFTMCRIVRCPKTETQSGFGRVCLYVILLLSLFNTNALQLLAFAFFDALGKDPKEHQYAMFLKIEFRLPMYQLLAVKDLAVLVSTALLQSRSSSLLSILLIITSAFSLLYLLVRGMAILRSSTQKESMKRVKSFALSHKINVKPLKNASSQPDGPHADYKPEFDDLEVASPSHVAWADNPTRARSPAMGSSRYDLADAFPDHPPASVMLQVQDVEEEDEEDLVRDSNAAAEQTMRLQEERIQDLLRQMEAMQRERDREGQVQSQIEAMNEKLNMLAGLFEKSQLKTRLPGAVPASGGNVDIITIAESVKREFEATEAAKQRRLEQIRREQEARRKSILRKKRRGGRGSVGSVPEEKH